MAIITAAIMTAVRIDHPHGGNAGVERKIASSTTICARPPPRISPLRWVGWRYLFLPSRSLSSMVALKSRKAAEQHNDRGAEA